MLSKVLTLALLVTSTQFTEAKGPVLAEKIHLNAEKMEKQLEEQQDMQQKLDDERKALQQEQAE